MTASKKLFIAAALLAAGFGVARLMGRPDAPWLTHVDNVPVARRSGIEGDNPIGGAGTANSVQNGARLVPEINSEDPYQARLEASASNAQQTSSSAYPAIVINADAPPLMPNSNLQPSRASLEPRAKLLDEAPRPLDFDPRGPATVYTRPAATPPTVEVAPVAAAHCDAPDWRAGELAPAGFVVNTNSGATITASYNQPVDLATNTGAVAPPPWPEPAEPSGPRIHVVVDGDSLERLAGRYLDDASRGNEIYEANRELLVRPDLLPIGAELVIPKGTNRAPATSPQSSAAKDPAFRAASHRGVMRPFPPPVNVVPRAQLLSPVPIN